ncbi:hypothetical protein OH76DRAFT_1234568 [Lentinus brumalis]|uniref:Uncharacterized protein n=1 Tax=Lentinus brumalis TaxID=2498619 RepID=A0A371CSI3_9APHY|nr:hypothetical protein OH76DRAFT_1234568 [Polyporus brumalis]
MMSMKVPRRQYCAEVRGVSTCLCARARARYYSFTTFHAPGRSMNQVREGRAGPGEVATDPGGRSMPGRRGVLVLFLMADCFLTISSSRRI